MINEPQQIDIIIAGCKAGDRKAQEALYRSFYKSMMNLCLRYTKNDQDAKEVLNTGFYKVFKNIHQYESTRASLYTWIRTIVINNCIDHAGLKEKKIETVEIGLADETGVPPDIVSQLSATHLLSLIRQLPAATQAVFNLYIIEGYNHREIAILLKISEGTSKWHLGDARKKLQAMINEVQ